MLFRTALFLCLLAGAFGCSDRKPSRPRETVGGATVDSAWVAAFRHDRVVLGVAGYVMDTCSVFDGASVTYVEPDSHLVAARSRHPTHVPCGLMLTPYVGEFSFPVRPGLTTTYIRGWSFPGTWRVWPFQLTP